MPWSSSWSRRLCEKPDSTFSPGALVGEIAQRLDERPEMLFIVFPSRDGILIDRLAHLDGAPCLHMPDAANSSLVQIRICKANMSPQPLDMFFRRLNEALVLN